MPIDRFDSVDQLWTTGIQKRAVKRDLYDKIIIRPMCKGDIDIIISSKQTSQQTY